MLVSGFSATKPKGRGGVKAQVKQREVNARAERISMQIPLGRLWVRQTELGLMDVDCADEQDAEALSWGRHGRRQARPVGLAFPRAVLLLWPGVTRE